MENESYEYEKFTFDVMDKMFENDYIVKKIQQDSYNDFISNLIPLIMNQYNPLTLGEGDRRIFYIHSKVTKRDSKYYGNLKNWMNNENGKWHFKKYLKREI